MANNLSFDILPYEIILQIASTLSLTQITSFCLSNKRFNEAICNNDFFWHQKFVAEIGPVEYNGSWKELYINLYTPWVFGNNSYGKIGPYTESGMILSPLQLQNIKVLQMAISDTESLIIHINNNIYQLKEGEMRAIEMFNNKEKKWENLKAKQVACGISHTIMIDLKDNIGLGVLIVMDN
jgi:hypothetical protein